ncbi:peptidase M24, structural domain-containing protein [Endogone sp. FLAS-F59071]|nr:peptidase M24, structural domain-containing protein [Endogone sp. FLAS-F59071]|eukprot:RUS23048.1 peptidase M24, structural domain-containing protein [Endogone sp. FLAS-F59071]
MAFRAFSHLTRNFTTSASRSSPRSKMQPNHTSPFFARAKRFGNYEVLVPAFVRPTLAALIPCRNVPEHIQYPDYAKRGEPTEWASEVDAESVRLSAADFGSGWRSVQAPHGFPNIDHREAKPGTTTDEIDRVLHDAIIDANAYPSPLNYMGFPRSVCTSVNNVIAHGIPDQRRLKSGDILNVDITVYLDGYHGDTSATFLVGDVDAQGRDIVECTREALWNAIGICGPGVELKEIGRTIRRAHRSWHQQKLSCPTTYISSWLNFYFFILEWISQAHTIYLCLSPYHTHTLSYSHWPYSTIPFYAFPRFAHSAENSEEGIMQPGMIFTIEPILCQGSAIGVMWPDRWTIVTADGGRSAQFEHTILTDVQSSQVLITEDGVEVLTQ